MPTTEAAPALPPEGPTTVGPYVLVAELGSGGAGRVFRARDSRLDRDVAVKMLHRAEADDQQAQRFLAEARAAGALNHPNILSVYDVGTADGRPYLVSELIDGVSLRAEIDAGRLTTVRVLELAAQMADGLAAAHAAGLVHRDLKPENVMISRGRAKIVDFGLAKAAGDAAAATSRTLTAPHAILGTPPYMSPEQARGVEVDFRSDLFSFGAIVYEMATGRRAFDRATAIETLTAIQHDDPVRMHDLNPRVPPRLQQIVGRCLAKAPEDRYASTADLHHDLCELRDGRASLETGAGDAAAKWWRRRGGAMAAAALGLAAAAAVVSVAAPSGRDLGRYRIVPVATEAGYEGAPAWSPNGQSLAYIAERDGVMQVMAKDLASTRSVTLTRAVADCRSPMWSPDGSRVYYISLAGVEDSLWSVSAAGGAPRLELRGVTAAAIAPSGDAVVFLKDEGAFQMTLWVSSPIGAPPRPFAAGSRANLSGGIPEIRFSPDGARIGLWTDSSAAAAKHSSRPVFWVIDYPAGTAVAALTSLPPFSRAYPFTWMADSRRIVFGTEALGRSPGLHLWVADTVSGRTEALTATSSNEYEPAVSPDGSRIAFVADASHYDVIEIPLTGGPVVTRASSAADDSDPAWTPSGRQYTYVTTRTGRPEVWLSDPEGAVDVPLVTRRSFDDDSFVLSRPTVSPDGQRLAFQRRNNLGFYLWTAPMAGGHAVPTVVEPGRLGYVDSPTWSPTGEWLAFTYIQGPDQDRGRASWIAGKVRPGSNEPIVELRRDVNYLTAPQWSPDGQWLTVELADGLYAIAPEAPAGGDGTRDRLVSQEPWLVHTWARDSRSLLAIRQSDDNRLQLASIDFATRAVTLLNPDLGPVPPTTPPLRGFSLSPDGTRLLTSIARLRGDIHVLDGFEGDDGLWARVGRLASRVTGYDPRPVPMSSP